MNVEVVARNSSAPAYHPKLSLFYLNCHVIMGLHLERQTVGLMLMLKGSFMLGHLASTIAAHLAASDCLE